MAIKLVVLDMAGTTVADDDAVIRSFQQAFEVFHYDVSAEDVRPLMGYKKTLAIKMVLENLGKTPGAAEIDTIHAVFVKKMVGHYSSSPVVKPAENAEATLRWLKDQGITTALNTGFPKQVADTIMRRLDWADSYLVDSYIASDEVEHGRPHPEMIHRLMKVHHIDDPAQVMKVGDTEVDVNEGRNADCGVVVGITSGAFTRAQLQEHQPDYIIDNLSELQHLIATHR